jgi:hypothetical protein
MTLRNGVRGSGEGGRRELTCQEYLSLRLSLRIPREVGVQWRCGAARVVTRMSLMSSAVGQRGSKVSVKSADMRSGSNSVTIVASSERRLEGRQRRGGVRCGTEDHQETSSTSQQ